MIDNEIGCWLANTRTAIAFLVPTVDLASKPGNKHFK